MTWLLLLLAWLLDTSTRTDRSKDTDPPPDSEDDGEEEDGEGEAGDGELRDRDGKPIRDPKAKLKAQEEQLDRLFKKLQRKDDRIKELEDQLEGADDVHSARLEAAFVRAVFEHRDSIDLEAAWDLANYKGFLDPVKVEEGTVEGMDEALARLIERYPYLIEETGSSDDGVSDKPKTRQPAPKRKGQRGADRASLQKRFPALRGRRRRP